MQGAGRGEEEEGGEDGGRRRREREREGGRMGGGEEEEGGGSNANLVIYNSGDVLWIPPNEYKVTCHVVHRYIHVMLLPIIQQGMWGLWV